MSWIVSDKVNVLSWLPPKIKVLLSGSSTLRTLNSKEVAQIKSLTHLRSAYNLWAKAQYNNYSPPTSYSLLIMAFSYSGNPPTIGKVILVKLGSMVNLVPLSG